MKKNHTVALSGGAFTKQLTADDITGVPEFLKAYMVHNGASLNAGVPAPKFKESERVSNPEKYKREREQYLQAIKRYIVAHPESTDGIDAQLGDSNPEPALGAAAGRAAAQDRAAVAGSGADHLPGRASRNRPGRPRRACAAWLPARTG